ncbi:MAG: glucuronate isomerase [Alicyclobacillus shizuokensis]|nr:glucuronate isomerase [Alicyclobacillus shizuokensis]
MHTHLYAPEMGSLLLCGADAALNFHYLVSESFRVHHMPYRKFWALSKAQRAEVVWNALFRDTSPVSEAASGVIEMARAMGCDTDRLTLTALRETLSDVPTAEYISRIMNLANVTHIVMTNDPFDDQETAFWQAMDTMDKRFLASLRIDRLMNQYSTVAPVLAGKGYDVDPSLSGRSIAELRRFLEDCADAVHPVYVAFSAADDLTYPEETGPRGRILREVVLPFCRERGIPLSLMIGARRRVNPALHDAGDSVVQADVRPVESLCADYPDNRFLVSMLARENQHALVVAARKFHNLMPFGCWWFVNTDTLVEEITRMRLELLGPTFVAQHSDARVLEHLIYKWQRARRVLTRVLVDKYQSLQDSGWPVTEEVVRRDVERLFSGNFKQFVGWA